MNKKSFLVSAAAVLVLALAAVSYYNTPGLKQKVFYRALDLAPKYASAFSLVDDKISQSAPIIINLPPETTAAEAQAKVKFTPEIKGQWLAGDDKKIAYQPKEKLKIGKYYTASLETPAGTIGKDFLVEEDPKVISIFPKEDIEANENADITIIFNRPIVPLSTLDAMNDNLPNVEIKPATKGKFKWIGTKTLQFIPETTLIPSANYSLEIKPGFKALDGLEVPALKYKFITRPLRYNFVSSGNMPYNQPIKINFNQNVDLEKTAKEIWLKNTSEDKRIDFIAEYGSKKVFNEKTKKYEDQQDRSAIYVYNKADRYHRAKLWDFKNNYFLMIEKAYPEKGDIILNEDRQTSINVGDAIESVSAQSEKTTYASLQYFDPDGKLNVSFFEEIDLAKTLIKSEKSFSAKYGEKCAEVGDSASYYSYVECQKTADKKKIIITFDRANLDFGQNFDLVFEKIVNLQNLQINHDAIAENITIAPKLKITSTVPASNDAAAGLTEFYVCSNSQLPTISRERAKEIFKANLDFEYVSGQASFKVEPNYYNYKCPVGEFQANFRWRLMPESDYKFVIDFNDVFGNVDKKELSFKTGAMPDENQMFYHFQKKFNIATPDKAILAYAAENMEYVDMNICRLAPEKMLQYLNKGLEYTIAPNYVGGCENAKWHKINLPKKYWVKNFFKVNLADYVKDTAGSYIITFTNPGYKEQWGQYRQVYERTYLNVSNLAITKKQINIGDFADNEKQEKQLKDFYWITDLKTLDGVSGAKIELYSSDYESVDFGLLLSSKGTTGADGTAQLAATSSIIGGVVTKDADSAIILNTENNFSSASTAYSEKRIYMYTDRPIYRPGNTVHLKGFYRLGFDGQYEIFRDKKIPLKVSDPAGLEIFSRELEINDFGTFNADFDLPAKSALGTYYISAGDYGGAYFDIEEYVPAPFKADVKSDKEEYFSGETFNLDVEAAYYFGAPLDGGEVEYSISAQDYYFDKYQDEYFDFGLPWYYCWGDCGYGDKFILRNSLKLDNAGRGRISQAIDFKNLFKDPKDRKSKIISVNMIVKNFNGQAIAAKKSFIFHAGEYYLGLKTDKYFMGKDEKFTLKAKTVDTAGKVKKIDNIKITLNEVKWVESKRQEVDGGFYYHWEEQLSPVATENISTDKDGNWSKEYSFSKEGEYRAVASGVDGRGNNIETTYEIYVYGEGYADVAPSNDTNLDIVVAKNNLNVGDNAEVVIKSPFKKAKALLSIERGNIFSYEIKDVGAGLVNYSFPIKEEYIPNVYFSATLISPDPEVKHGSVSFNINTKEKELDVNIKPNKDNYLPGEEVSINIDVKDKFGKPMETELSLAVVDMSVLALKGNPKKNPVMFYYSGFPLAVSTASNIKNILHVVDVPIGTKGGGGGGDDLAVKKRGDFKDTAYWSAIVKTDANGQANVKFKLPDNLTTWQAEAVGITRDTKLGAGYKEFMAKKDVMLSPLKPRFIVPGDEFSIGAKVFNQSSKAQKLKITISDTSLEMVDNEPRTIKLSPNEAQNIYFRVKAPANVWDGSHKFTLSAKNGNFEDTVSDTISITRNTTYENVATAGYSKADNVNEYAFLPDNVIKDQGSLDIKTSATLAVFMSSGLQSLLQYPYGCGEQIASKLNAIAILKKGLNLENIGDKFPIKDIEVDGKKYTIDELVETGLDKIYANQNSDGGFSYYPGYRSDYYLSLYTAEVFGALSEAGYKIDQERVNRLGAYLNNNFFNDYFNFHPANSDYILAAYSISHLKGDAGKVDKRITDKIKTFANDKKYLNETIGNLSLTRLAILLAENEKEYGKKYKDNVYNILENKVEIDSRGAFLPLNYNDFHWQYYETSIKDTAGFLRALVKDKRDNATLDRVLRWLLRSRAKDGSWDSTNNTASVIAAMTDYIAWQKENKSDFNLKILLNGAEKSSFDYGPATILNQNNLSLSLSDLGFNKLNAFSFRKTNNNKESNNFYYDLSLKYYLPANTIAPRDEGFSIERNFYRPEDKDFKNPVKEAKVGDVLIGHIKLFLPKDRNFVSVEDYIPAGVEIVNFNLATENKQALDNYYNSGAEGNDCGAYDCDYLRWWDNSQLYPDITESRDNRLFLYKERLSPGEYEYDYYVRVLVPGKFTALPAVASEMYFPENFGRTGGGYFVVNEKN